MAKKPLTPEQAEIKAIKKQKSSMGWTKFWAIVLALVLTVGVVFVGKTTADKALEAAGSNVVAGESSGDAGNAGDDDLLGGGDEDLLGGGDVMTDVPAGDVPAGDTPAADAPAADAPAGDSGNASQGGAAAVTFSKANAHEMFNKWTSGAAKMSYKWKRVCAYTPDGAINVGSATGALNAVIKGIDENSSLDTVVGGFLGIGNKDGEVKNGAVPEDMNQQYVLKAMQLTAADVKGAVANGNTYKVQLNACANPQKDNSNALSHATNDFFTHQEVVDGIAGFTTAIKVKSTDVQYSSILLTAVVDGDALKSLNISYTFTATMNLQIAFSITGKGKATNSITYTIA